MGQVKDEEARSLVRENQLAGPRESTAYISRKRWTVLVALALLMLVLLAFNSLVLTSSKQGGEDASGGVVVVASGGPIRVEGTQGVDDSIWNISQEATIEDVKTGIDEDHPPVNLVENPSKAPTRASSRIEDNEIRIRSTKSPSKIPTISDDSSQDDDDEAIDVSKPKDKPSSVNSSMTVKDSDGETDDYKSSTEDKSIVDEERSDLNQREQRHIEDNWAGQKFSDWTEELAFKADRCRSLAAKLHKVSDDHRRLYEADCGLGYNFTMTPARAKQPWRVVFYGSRESGMMLFTGCPTVGKGGCPLAPECSMIMANDPAHLPTADVVVVFQMDPRRILDVNYDPVTKKPYRVTLWREAVWRGPRPKVQQEYYDFEIGTHHTAPIPNPQWFLSPSDLLSGRLYTSEKIPFIPLRHRKGFAISIISHCTKKVTSKRDFFLANLIDYLGDDMVHRYGKCGTRELPPRPISNAAKLISKYKYYLALENTIQEGYVSEKLLEILALPILPVYYGAPNVPNITKTPSFIKASDFRSPSRLADYLLHLDANPQEYNKYHAWRKEVNPFDDYYLNLLKTRIAGPLEVEAYKDVSMKENNNDELNYQYRQRRAQCCRLCDAEFLKTARENRGDIIPVSWDEDKINSVFFNGTMYGEGDKYKKIKPLSPQ